MKTEKTRLLLVLTAITLMALSITGCKSKGIISASGKAKGSDEFSLVFTGQDSEGLPSTEAMYWIASEVEKRTNGKVEINVYPANQYGSADLQYQGIMDGSIDMLLGYLDPTYDKVFDVTTIPFLASNYEEIAYICSNRSNTYKLFSEHCESTDMHFMGFFLNGVNGIFSAKDLGDYLDPDAKKSTLIRIANSAIYQTGIEALGYPTITIPYTDTYTSMQTGVMDGMTGIPSYMVHQNFADVTKYYLAMDMFLEANVIIMSPETVEELPQEYLDIIQDVCDEASANSLVTTEHNVEEGIRMLVEDGIDVLPITDEERGQVASKVRAKIQDEMVEYFGPEIISQVNEDIENASKSYEGASE